MPLAAVSRSPISLIEGGISAGDREEEDGDGTTGLAATGMRSPDDMTFPSPAPPTPPSILLLRALARCATTGIPITTMLALATAIGVRPADLVLLLRRGLDAGYLRDDDGVLTLSEQGHAWLARHHEEEGRG